ncbi:IS630 family transposase [Streptomyces sp. SDr-06]|uniref:IS630 family transposase n=1 Tax=Streptomyces sp. SDr-06 TaxID=2267702 RepID=UPI00295002CA|nr:IS630 family transposase [Streptomyces sp. SDr-06]
MRPSTVYANASATECQRLRGLLRGRWRPAARAVMVLLSLHGLSPAQIAALMEYDPATVRRWIGRFNTAGVAGLADHPRSGRPRLGGRRLPARIAALLARPWPWTVRRLHRYLGRPQISHRTLYRRLRQVAVWRRPKLIARGDPARDAVTTAVRRRAAVLPDGAKIFTADETHVHLLPHVHARWTLPGYRPEVPTPGKNRQITVYGALEVTTGAFFYRLGHRCAADFLLLLQQLLAAYPDAPAIAVICDNDQIHHARTVRDFLAAHPGTHLWFGARYSPHDNPTERIWAALKNFIADTAVSWPGRRRQIHAFFRGRSPDQNLATAAPWTSPWFPAHYRQDFWKAA